MEARTLLAEHERDLYALAKDDRASLYAATVFAFLLVLTNTNVAAEQVKDLLQSHGAELVSPQFHESVRAQMGEDVAAEWSRRINALLSGLA
jgi:hypothetical protein